jgi:aminopeptidase N
MKAFFVLASSILFALTTVAVAHPPHGSFDHDPPTGCNKAEILRGRFLSQQAVEEWRREYKRQVAGGLREALEDTDLLHIDLEIEVIPGGNPNLKGTNTLTLESRVDGLTIFTFRLRSQYVITTATINGATPVTVSQMSTTTRQATLDRPYNTGEVFTLTIAYEGVAQSVGFGSIEFLTHGPFSTPIVSTLSEPYYAYSWWPAKDGDFGVPGDNSDKFTADFAIISDNSLSSAANGVLQGIDPLSGNRHRYRWSTAYPIATYLVAFSTTNYTQWSQDYTPIGGGSMPVLFYIYPESDTPTNRAAWERSIDMLVTFRDFYGEYPFVAEKYGIYQFPFGGGMEHQTFTGQGGFGESLTAHELAHQWWGDAVTCETWSDIWLNEGFATFSECLWEEFKTGVQNKTAYFNCMQARKPSQVNNSVYVPAADTSSVSRIFSSTFTYRKGAWVVHMLRRLAGDSTFFDILAAHRAAHEDDAATTAEFANVASAVYGQNLNWFFNQWVYAIGAPAYTYGWQSINVAAQNYLLVRIEQTHTDMTFNWPATFIAPVDLVATVSGSPTNLEVWNNARTQWFVLPTAATTTALQFDPNQWILRTAGSSVAYVPGPPKIVATQPAPGEEVDVNVGLDQISVTFHTAVNATAAHVSLVGNDTGARSLTLVSGAGVNPLTAAWPWTAKSPTPITPPRFLPATVSPAETP